MDGLEHQSGTHQNAGALEVTAKTNSPEPLIGFAQQNQPHQLDDLRFPVDIAFSCPEPMGGKTL